MVSARPRSDGDVHGAEGGKRPEGLLDIRFQRWLVALDGEEVVTAAINDRAANGLLREDRIAGDDRAFQRQRLQHSSAAVISLAAGSTRNWPITPSRPVLNAASRWMPGAVAVALPRRRLPSIATWPAGAPPCTHAPRTRSNAATLRSRNNSHHTEGAGTRGRVMPSAASASALNRCPSAQCSVG